jgi:hypothetical protein
MEMLNDTDQGCWQVTYTSINKQIDDAKREQSKGVDYEAHQQRGQK